MRRSTLGRPLGKPTLFTYWQAILNLGFLPHDKPKGPPRYITTGQGWLYLTVILDLADRKVIGWAMSDNMKAVDTTVSAWRMALKNREINSHLLFHSDRGIQYACTEFRDELGDLPVEQSMSRKGNCWDNAVAESFLRRTKAIWSTILTLKHEQRLG